MSATAVRELRVSTGYRPRPWQQAVHAAIALVRFAVLIVHRRGGKTVLAVNALVDAALRCQRPNPRFAYIAPLLKQAREVSWPILRQFTKAIPGVEYHESTLQVRFPNGATIQLYGADNPDAMRGHYFDGVVLDEVADMRPEVWDEIIPPCLADRSGWALFIGTPKGINLLSRLYFEALQNPEWFATLLRWQDTDALPEDEIELARRTMPASRFAQEFECDFQAANENALISQDLARGAAGKHVPEDAYSWAPKVLGVDVARYGDDRTVIFPRQGLVAFAPIVMRHADTMEVAARVASAVERFGAQQVFVDVAGLGAGVVDRLKQLRHPVLPVEFGGRPLRPQFRNKRSEMWAAVAEWLKSGGAIPQDEALIADLCAPQFTFGNAANQFALESKDEMRERGLPSPDLGDALACTFAFPVALPATEEERFARRYRKPGTARYNPRIAQEARA